MVSITGISNNLGRKRSAVADKVQVSGLFDGWIRTRIDADNSD